jgi:hypothetical protein
MSNNWKQVIASVAPTLATALGGPLGGLAASVAGKILLGKTSADPGEVQDFVLAHQTPETFLKLKQVEAELAKEQRELEIESEPSRRGTEPRRETGTRKPKIECLGSWQAWCSQDFLGFWGR